MKTLRSKKGFTLIELVVVIVILGILMMLVIPRIGEYQKGAQQTTCQGNRRILASSQAAYYATDRRYATDVATLILASLVPTNIGCPTATVRGSGNYALDNADYFRWTCTTSGIDSKYNHNRD